MIECGSFKAHANGLVPIGVVLNKHRSDDTDSCLRDKGDLGQPSFDYAVRVVPLSDDAYQIPDGEASCCSNQDPNRRGHQDVVLAGGKRAWGGVWHPQELYTLTHDDKCATPIHRAQGFYSRIQRVKPPALSPS
jgi:hypothetical protein